MKKSTFLLLILIICIITIITAKPNNKDDKEEYFSEKRGIFISYIELSEYLDKDNKDDIKNEINKMITNIKQDKFNMIILQTRAFSDSIFESKIYPTHYLITGNDNEDIPLDILEYFIEQAHFHNIEVHAWINPYRIRNNTDYTKINIKNPAFKWIGTNNVKIIDNKGIFYNPSSEDVIELIVTGIKEIIDNYNVDGILFDDYFYPSTDIDSDNYNNYIKEHGDISLKEYHYNNVLLLIKKIHDLTKDKNIDFSISPDGNIDNNLETHFLNINELLSSSEYVDYIIPQLYYGFKNEAKPFIKTLNEWNNKISESIKLMTALALYKSGNYDKYAKSGSNEWLEYTNIISNQIKISRSMSNYRGYAIYRYDYFYNNVNDFTVKEVENIRKM